MTETHLEFLGMLGAHLLELTDDHPMNVLGTDIWDIRAEKSGKEVKPLGLTKAKRELVDDDKFGNQQYISAL